MPEIHARIDWARPQQAPWVRVIHVVLYTHRIPPSTPYYRLESCVSRYRLSPKMRERKCRCCPGLLDTHRLRP